MNLIFNCDSILAIMGCNTSKTYIAKETYHPYDNEWEGFTTQSYEESRVRKKSKLIFNFQLEYDISLVLRLNLFSFSH